MAAPATIIHSHWHYLFDGVQFSAKAFYALVKELLKQRQIPGLSIMHIALAEGNIFSSRREYLRVTRNQYIFDICAAPFGTGFFVSWWLGENPGCLPTFLTRQARTYFRIDTETMFKETVKHCVQEAIESMSKARGYRSLTELERQTKDYSK